MKDPYEHNGPTWLGTAVIQRGPEGFQETLDYLLKSCVHAIAAARGIDLTGRRIRVHSALRGYLRADIIQ